MRFRVDISQGEGAQRNAVALHMDLPGEREAFVIAEVARTDKAALGLLQAALSALTGTLACPDPAESPQRQLDSAFQAANRLVYTKKIQNPAVDDLLVSAAVVLVSPGTLAVANSGTTMVFLRTQDLTVGITTPEHAASRLGEHGLTGKAALDEKSLAPVNGLGLSHEVFRLKQQKTMEEPLQYELVMVGSQLLARLSPADISAAIQSKDRELPTADRIYQMFTAKMGSGSSVMSARRLMVSQPAWHTVPEHVPSAASRAWTPVALGAFGVLVLAGLIYLLMPPTPKAQFDKPKERDLPSRVRPAGEMENLILPNDVHDALLDAVEEPEPPAPVVPEKVLNLPPALPPEPAAPTLSPLLEILEQKATAIAPTEALQPDPAVLDGAAKSDGETPAGKAPTGKSPAGKTPGGKQPGAKTKDKGGKAAETPPEGDVPVDEISDGPVQVIDFSEGEDEKPADKPKIRDKRPPKGKDPVVEPPAEPKPEPDVTPEPKPEPDAKPAPAEPAPEPKPDATP